MRSRLLRGCGVCRRTAFCVAGAVIAWPRWAPCCGHVYCVAMVCVVVLHFVSQALSLHGHGGCCIAVAFIAWPQCVSSRHILCCGHCRCVATVGAVLRSRLLRGRGVCHRAAFCVVGAVIAWPRWALCCGCVCCLTAVCVVVSRSGLLCGHRGCRVAVAFVMWLRCVSSCHVVSWLRLLCDRGGCLLAMLCRGRDGWGHGGLLRERVCPSARRPIECSNWAAKEEVSKKQTKRKHTSRAGG